MKRIDITDQWDVLSVNPVAMQAFVLDQYGADRVELADWPHAEAWKGDQRIGLVNTHGYPRITIEEDRVYLELADLEAPSP